jgi:hypothetical protein
MIYSILKVWVRLAARIFCRKIIINKKVVLKEKGPIVVGLQSSQFFFGFGDA